MMYLYTPEQHAQILDALHIDAAEARLDETLAMLKAMQPVEAIAKICHRQNGHASLWWNEQQALDRNEGYVFSPLYTPTKD